MHDSKLFDAVRALSAQEKADFALFLLSPFFQKGFAAGELQLFYDLILQSIDKPMAGGITKEGVHGQVFPGKTFVESRMDRLMFELNRLIRVFLITKHYLREENEVQHTIDYAAIQRSKGQSFRVEKYAQKSKKGKTYQESPELFFDQYLIAREEHEWQSMYNKLKGDLGVPDLISSLDLFYFTLRLEMLNRFLLQQRAATLETPQVIRYALEAPPPPEHYIDAHPLLLITNKIHQLLRQPDPAIDGFNELMHLLESSADLLSPEVLRQFYSYLRNLCTILIDAGNVALNAVLHHLNQDNLRRGYFYHEGKIPPNAAANITMMAIRANNIEWAKNFIELHKGKIIDENETQDFYRMNVALVLFAEKKYEEALEMIPFGSTYSGYHLMARRLELKSYYELKSDLLPSKIDAFKMYISRASNKTFSANLSELYANFGNFVLQLSQSVPGDKKRSEQLIQRIQSKKLVAERGWLLEKAAELAETSRR
jgi:hypothetical protein